MIVCLGTTPAVQRSMTFGRLEIDGVNRTADVSQYASGKSVNAARVLHTLDKYPLAVGFAGGDSGTFLLADLASSAIAADFVDVSAPTRMCITLIDASRHTATELIEESSTVTTAAYEALIAKLERFLPTSTGLLSSGSLPPHAPADFYARCVALANSAGKFTVLDAAGEPLARALGSGPTVVKPNRDELAKTVGRVVSNDAELKSAIAQLVNAGTKWAVVTGGKLPTIVSDGRQFWSMSTPQVKVVSAIGSGDSFAAGLTAGLSEGATVPEACRLAVACGAANAMTDRAGHVSAADVKSLQQQVSLSTF